MTNENESKRIAVYATNEVLEICDLDMKKANAANRSQFICEAVKFYHCYLNRELNTEVLTPAFETVIDARLDLTEYRLSQTIFKLAVEMACTMNVFAGAFKIDPEKIRNMKHRVINEVKSLNGAIDFENIVKYQNGEL